MHFHLKDELEEEFIAYKSELMKEGALTLFALYDIIYQLQVHMHND